VASVHVAGVWSVQGCVLANTAIEKYLKALYVHLELSTLHSHAVQALYREVTSSNKCTVALNDAFLDVLQKTYGLCYPDALPNDFNIALNQMKVLAELDRTVFAITTCFKFGKLFSKKRSAESGTEIGFFLQ